MRQDFAKLIVEDGHRGGGPSKKWGGRIQLHMDYDSEIGGFQPWSRKRNTDYRSHGDYLSPIHGFLLKNCGRLWDDVYSEICQTIPDGIERYHVVQGHILPEVVTNTWVGDDGYVWGTGRGYSKAVGPIGGRYRSSEFYVDPVNRNLCYWESSPKPFKYHGKGDPYIPLVSGSYYSRTEDFWYYYEIKVHTYTHSWIEEKLEMVDGEVVIREIPRSREHTKTEYIKRQIGGKELRRVKTWWYNKVKNGDFLCKTPEEAREANTPDTLKKHLSRWYR